MYWTVFGSLILGAMGFPIPEEVPLIVAGLAVAAGEVSPQWMFILSFVGVLVGDQFMYFMGLTVGHKLLSAGTRSPLLPAMTEERVNEVREGLRKKRLMYLFIGRHLFFLRSVTFLVAGTVRIPFLEFLFADFLAACFSVTIFFGLGYFLGGRIAPENIPIVIHSARVVLLSIVGIGLTIAVSVALFKYARCRKKS